MRWLWLFITLLVSLLPFSASGATQALDPKLILIQQKLSGFSESEYASAVEKTLTEFEKSTGKSLRPGPLKKCALKITTEGGIGLATPKALTRAVATALIQRGFTPEGIIICDNHLENLRIAGYIPQLADAPQKFGDFPVQAWNTLAPAWAQEKRLQYENQVLPRPNTPMVPWGDPHISVLPKTLFDDVDFWINLPVLSDSKAVGVQGAMAAASLGNMANSERFADNPFNAAKATVEVCAIPELAKKNILTLLSLERYQVLGGPYFDANWCRSEKMILASANPVILDFIGLQKINKGRATSNMDTIHPEPPVFAAANSNEVHLGSCRATDITLVQLNP
jgi:hypothetical protein